MPAVCTSSIKTCSGQMPMAFYPFSAVNQGGPRIAFPVCSLSPRLPGARRVQAKDGTPPRSRARSGPARRLRPPPYRPRPACAHVLSLAGAVAASAALPAATCSRACSAIVRRGGCVRRLTGRGLLARTFCQLWSSKCLSSVFCPSEETGRMILSLGTCLGLMVH